MERTELRSAAHPGLFTDDQKLVNDKLGDEIMMNMGVEPYLVADGVACVVAQRLHRLVCEECKSEYKPEPGEFASLQLGVDDRDRPMYRGMGCEKCNQTGCRGRSAIYSILQMTPAVARQGYQANTGFPGSASVPVGGMRSALFMAHQDMLYVILFLYCIVNMQYSTARVAEEMFDTFVLQKLDYYF